MPGIDTFSHAEIGDRWAESLRKCDSAIKGLEAQIDAADQALIEVGIASVGSLRDRILRLAAERDRPNRCPACGYTDEDARYHGDHYLCKGFGSLPHDRS